MSNDSPALNADGTLKDASEMDWYGSDSEQAPMPKNGVAAPVRGHEKSSPDGAVAPTKTAASLTRLSRDQPNRELILEGSRQRKPTARAVEGQGEASGKAQDFFRPKSSKCVYAFTTRVYSCTYRKLAAIRTLLRLREGASR